MKYSQLWNLNEPNSVQKEKKKYSKPEADIEVKENQSKEEELHTDNYCVLVDEKGIRSLNQNYLYFYKYDTEVGVSKVPYCSNYDQASRAMKRYQAKIDKYNKDVEEGKTKIKHKREVVLELKKVTPEMGLMIQVK